MARNENWPERLHEAMLARSHKPFIWGETDCLLTACDLIQAITGVDPGAPYRGQYANESGALRIAVQAGCRSFEELVAQIAAAHSFAEISPKLAQRGDLVLLDSTEGLSFGVVSLNGREAVFAGEQGLRRLPVLQARRAWRIS